MRKISPAPVGRRNAPRARNASTCKTKTAWRNDQYDTLGRITLSQSRLGLVIFLSGTGANQTTTLTTSGTLLTSSETVYDNLDRATLSTDTYGFETQTTYDPFGNVTQSRRETLDEK